MAVGDGRTDYGVTPQRFVAVWQRAQSAKEAAEILGMPIDIACVRASEYRAKGVKLRKHRRVAGTLDIDELNAIIQKVDEENAVIDRILPE